MSQLERLIYVPTDRLAVDAITAGVAEAATLQRDTGGRVPFLLVEQPSRPEYTDAHRNELFRSGRRFGVATLQLTSTAWRQVSDRLRSELAAQQGIVELLETTKRAYGVAPNKAYLVATALGATTIHRRDSDHLPDHDDNGAPRWPGQLEASLLGRTVTEVGLIPPPGAVDGRILFAASSMLGERPIDRRSLIEVDVEHLYALEQLAHPERTRERIVSRVQEYYFDEPSRRDPADSWELDRTGITEIGVSGLAGLFRQLPECPSPGTLGTDYMVKNLLYQLGWPVVRHSRKMVHRYADERIGASVQNQVEYAMSDARFLIFRRLLADHNQSIQESPTAFLTPDGRVRADRYAANLLRVTETGVDQVRSLPAGFAAVYRQAGSGTGSAATANRAIADQADRTGAELVASVVRGLVEYCRLVRAWPDLVARMAALGPAVLSHLTVDPELPCT